MRGAGSSWIYEKPYYAKRGPVYSGKCNGVAYNRSVTMPVHDMFTADLRIVCAITVYGVSHSDLASIPIEDGRWTEKTREAHLADCIGPKPFRKAIKRMGLDPNRYQVLLWDIVS